MAIELQSNIIFQELSGTTGTSLNARIGNQFQIGHDASNHALPLHTRFLPLSAQWYLDSQDCHLFQLDERYLACNGIFKFVAKLEPVHGFEIRLDHSEANGI